MKINEFINDRDDDIKPGDVLMIESDGVALVGVVLGVKDGAVLIEGDTYPLDEKDDHNFDENDIKQIERMSDIVQARKAAFDLISTDSRYPMDPDKVRWFKTQLMKKRTVQEITKMLYDMLLSGEGHAVIGSRYSTAKSGYRHQFKEEDDDNVIRSLGQRQAQKNKTPYQYNADIADQIPRYDSVKRRNIPAGFEMDNPNAVAYDRFEAVPVNDRIANIVGIAPDGGKVKVSTTTVQAAIALADAYNRGGFTDQDIQRVKFDEVKQRLDPKCWTGYRKQGTKVKDGVRVNNCVKVNETDMDEEEEELYYDAINHMDNLYYSLEEKKFTQAASYLSELGMLYQEAGVYLPDAIDMITDRRTKMHIERIYGLLDNNKDDVIRGVLTMIKTGNESATSVTNLISVLAEFGVDWPELDTIEAAVIKSLPNRINEAEYQGRTVQLGKPTRGDVRKYKVFVKNPKTGNIKKVNFGDPNMEIKRDDPKRRKSFRARHGCGTPRASDRTKAAYWSCRMWSSKPVSKILKGK